MVEDQTMTTISVHQAQLLDNLDFNQENVSAKKDLELVEERQTQPFDFMFCLV